MSLKKASLALFSSFVLIFAGGINVFAMNTGFSTDNLQPDVYDKILSNTVFSLITEEPSKDGIKCFDVNDNGLIAIGIDGTFKKMVLVYSEDGLFKYGYEFDDSGTFGLEWDEENIIIYFSRSSVAILVDPSANILELKEIPETSENNSYWLYSVYSDSRKVNSNEYIVRKNLGLLNIFCFSYTQLIKTDLDGNTTIIYDAKTECLVKILLMIAFIALFFSIALYRIKLRFKKEKNSSNSAT